MICKNCGLEIQDDSKFCNHCGAEQIVSKPKEEVAQPELDPQEQDVVTPEPEEKSQEDVVESQDNIPQTQQVEPRQAESTESVEPNEPQQSETESQPSMFQPMIDTIKGIDFKKLNPKNNPKPTIIAGSVVAIFIVCAVIFNIIFSGGVEGLVDKMEDAINEKNSKLAMECYPEFMHNGLDNIGEVNYLSNLGVEVDLDIISEKDVTDEDYDYDSSYTWKKYVENYYSDFSGYDGEVVQKVEKVTVKLEMDTDIDFLDSFVDMQDSTEELTVVKLDGDWYIFK